jgi:hypothetical protein
MNDCGSDHSTGTCEPSLALSIASGSQTDVLVSDYSSKDKRSTRQKARWFAPPIERPARRIFAPAIAKPRGKSEHLSTLYENWPTQVFACPRSDSAPGITVEVSNRFGQQSNTALAS